MSGRDPSTHAHAEYPNRPDDSAELVGVAGGDPYYADVTRGRLAPGVEHGGGIVPDWQDARVAGPDQTVGDLVSDIEERVGWESLTEFAEDLLGDDES